MPRRIAGISAVVASVLCAASARAQLAPLGIPMSRAGSGTSWLPDSSPMRGVEMRAGAWNLMAHGTAFLQYDRQGGPRGSDQFGSVNWGMLAASRAVAGGSLQLSAMMSLEPFTIGAHGYPLLLQTGETYHGAPLTDRQHPHDLFMELAARYDRAIARDLALSLYVAPVGEPASGPVAFPHRPSAENDPFAPIGHHWQDATHIAFGVATLGVFTRTLKVEGSVFNGREPDENRTNFDYAGRSLDSYAGRVTWNPGGDWSLSSSFAFLKSPDALDPGQSEHRVTASALYSRALAADRSFDAAAIFGANRPSGTVNTEPSYLVEANFGAGRQSVFGRAEYVAKELGELGVPVVDPAALANVGEVSLGYAFDFSTLSRVRIGVGAMGTLNFVPAALRAAYGSTMPVGFAFFLRVRPARMTMGGRGMMRGMPMNGAE